MFKVIAAVLALTVAAAGQTLHVPSQYPTIKAALAAATPGSTVLIADGVYTGSGNISLSFGGKAITVRSENGPAACIIDAGHAATIVTFSTGEGAGSILQGLTLRRGNGSEGGAIKCQNASPTIRGCNFEQGRASYHGSGVGCVSGSSPVIRDCTFADGLAGVGGAVYAVGGSHPKLIGCTIRDHRTDLFGGGAAGCDATSSITIDRCAFRGNQATGFSPYGGAIVSAGNLTVTNSLFFGNSGLAGAAIACSGGTAKIVNCTFSANFAGTGGGAVWSQASVLTVTNCILWGDAPDELAGGPALVTYSGVMGGYAGAGNISADPGFISPGAGDLRIGAGSACIDAGNSTAAPVPLDLAGAPRRLDDPATPDTGVGPPPVVDIGAYEFQPATCYPDCNGDGVLNLSDFGCFTTMFALGDPYADCNQDGARNLADFGCFQTKFALGCP
ncbi:MAG: right-handed parallel beta-helix repeat-containing protein [Phycisphaerales bacterium]|nr:right-handed parallel beta-helix repeat-containing protein [Phycisphaerales bacterium]